MFKTAAVGETESGGVIRHQVCFKQGNKTGGNVWVRKYICRKVCQFVLITFKNSLPFLCFVSHFLTPISFSLPRDEVQLKTAYSKSNGQPKSIGSASPGPGQPPLSSPTRGGVKKVSGVGGTTYEISV